MSVTSESTDSTAPDVARLGPELVHRLRLPGPPRRGLRPAVIGSVASSSARFATSLARPVPIRRRLQGPEVAEVHSFRNAASSPPRWWHPDLVPAPEPSRSSRSALPRRGLPRAVHGVPTEQTRSPGGILGSLTTQVVPVRRMEAVVAAGPMLTSHDRARLTATVRRTASADDTASAPPAPRVPATAPARPQARRDQPAAPSATRPAAPSGSTPDGPAASRPDAPSPAVGPSAPSMSTSTSAPTSTPAPAPAPGSAPTSAGGPAPVGPGAGPSSSGRGPGTSGAAVPGTTGAPVASSLLVRRRAVRTSRLAAVRGPGGPLGARRFAADAPRAVGSLALAHLAHDTLAPSRAVEPDPRGRVAPLRRMVGGAHAISPAAGVAQAPTGTSGLPLRLAGDRRAEPETGGRHRASGAAASRTAVATPTPTPSPGTPAAPTPAATSTPPGAAPTQPVTRPADPTPAVSTPAVSTPAVPTSTMLPAPPASATTASPAENRPAGTTPVTSTPRTPHTPLASTAGTPAPAPLRRSPATGAGPAGNASPQTGPTAAAPPRTGRRRAVAGGPAGIGLATARRMPTSTSPGSAVRPALAASLLPALATAHAWLPGAQQRSAAAPDLRRSSWGPRVRGSAGAGVAPVRARTLGMTDLLSTSTPLASDPESGGARAPLATAFASPDPIRPASAGAPAPAPPVGTSPVGTSPVGTAATHAPATARTGSPLAVARRRAQERGTTASALAAHPGSHPVPGPVAAMASTASAASAASAASPASRASMTSSASLASSPSLAAPAARGRLLRTSTMSTASTAPSHLPAPPPVSIRNPESSGAAVPPIPASGRVSGGGTLRRSLIDVTAGMFDDPAPVRREPVAASGSELVPHDEGGSAVTDPTRRLQVVRETTTVEKAVSPLDDPATMAAFVDEVVDRIEARVIDELERRGRRHNPGVF